MAGASPAPQVQNDPIINLPNLYKYGLNISNPFGNSSKQLYISAGSCRDSNNVMDIVVNNANVENEPSVPSPLVLNANVVGANGIDQGRLSLNTMYAVYMIADSSYYNPVACILTLATNSVPSMPMGYDSYRLIGYWGTNGATTFYEGTYQGIGNDLIFWYGGTYIQVLNAGVGTVLTNVDLTPALPPVDNTLVILTSNFIPAAAGDYYRVASLTSSAADFFQYGQVATFGVGAQFTVNAELLTGDPTIQYVVSTASANLSLWMNGFYVSV